MIWEGGGGHRLGINYAEHNVWSYGMGVGGLNLIERHRQDIDKT